MVKNLTEGKPFKTVVSFAMPMILANFIPTTSQYGRSLWLLVNLLEKMH